MRYVCIVGLCMAMAATTSAASGVVINHTNFDPSGLSQQTMDMIGGLNIYFEHASVGGNMLGGLSDRAKVKKDDNSLIAEPQ